MIDSVTQKRIFQCQQKFEFLQKSILAFLFSTSELANSRPLPLLSWSLALPPPLPCMKEWGDQGSRGSPVSPLCAAWCKSFKKDEHCAKSSHPDWVLFFPSAPCLFPLRIVLQNPLFSSPLVTRLRSLSWRYSFDMIPIFRNKCR